MTAQRRPSGCMAKILKSAGILTLALILILAGLNINQRITLARTRQMYPALGKLVEVDDRRMHIHCLGSGAPTVVIDAGNGSFSVEWMPIQEQLSQSVRTCAFDRSGYGWSEPGPEPRDGAQAVAELHALLQGAGETGPFILVGHSLGGVYARLFAAQYPAEAAGLVLVDTAYPLEITSEFERQMAGSIGFYRVMHLLTGSGIMRILGPLGGENSMPETARKLPPDLQDVYLNLLLDPQQYKTAIAEMENLPRAFEQTDQLLVGELPLGDLPLIVLTAGQTTALGSTPFAQELVSVPPERIETQAELAATSSRGEQRVLPESGHSVHLDAPEAVIQAVEALIARIGSSK